MSYRSIAELLLLAALWGAAFLFMRVGAPEFGPIPLIFVRCGIAALVLLLVVRLLNPTLLGQITQHWRPLAVLGLLNTAIPFCLYAYASLSITAGVTATLNTTAPLLGAVVGVFWLKERLTSSAILGLLLGAFGVAVLVYEPGQMQSDTGLAYLAAISAAGLYGISACFSKHYAQGIAPLTMATGSQCFAAIILLLPAFFTWPSANPSVWGWINVVILGVACTGLAFILYFGLLAREGVSRALSVTYLIPLFATGLGIIWLHEPVHWQMLLGALLILLGVALTTGLLVLGRRKLQVT